MSFAIPLAWLQLSREKPRLLVAVAGVAFAVVLILMQLGFQDALFASAVRFHGAYVYDLAMIDSTTDTMVVPERFSRRRLYQTVGFPAVASVSPVYIGMAPWRNPAAEDEAPTIYVVGFDPSEDVFTLPGVRAHAERLKLPDVVLFDRNSRPEFGPVAELFAERGEVMTEVGNRSVAVVGLFELGTSFGIDASLVTSDLNFLRVFSARPKGLIDLGLIRLRPGADVDAVREELAAALPRDVHVLTRDGFMQREIEYWNRNTPIGYVFSFGVIIGLTVGLIIVYQILFADVSDHLQEYATLKAMGYRNSYLFKVVIQEAVILAVLGFIPGIGIALWLYRTAGEATQLPLEMTAQRALAVLALAAGMCCASGAMALRKVRSADPADVF